MNDTRYDRHRLLLTDVAWERMVRTPVVVAGVGGLGSHVLSNLARLAPLTIEIWDPAVIDAPDLNRQILYTEPDLGRRKTDAAAEALRQINGDLSVFAQSAAISAAAFQERSAVGGGTTSADGGGAGAAGRAAPDGRTAEPPFVLFDCLDSFAARAELEAIRLHTGCTVIHGGVEGWYGQATTLTGDGPGYPGVFGPRFAETAAAAKPILPTTVATVAALQVTEFIHLCNRPAGTPLAKTPLTGTMAIYDGRRMTIDLMEIAR